MVNHHSARVRGKNGFAFFMGFVRHPARVGSVVPSSRFLERRLAGYARTAVPGPVVELGPGTGGTTRAMLAEMAPGARLLAIERDSIFVDLLGDDDDDRLIVHHGSAEDLAGALSHYRLEAPALVVSGIPFSTMPRPLGRRILDGVWSALAPGGMFVAYQFRGHVAALGREILGRPETELEPINVPPMRVYRWRKPLNHHPR